MKLERLSTIKKVALVAVFFISAIAGRVGHAADKKAVLKFPDERVLRLFDQAVKLSRRFDTDTKKQNEPLKSMLIELSDYHEDEQAGILEADGKTRATLMPIGPWALARLARLQIQLGDEEAAASLYQRLGDDFKGLDVVEPEPGAGILREKAEIASLRGRLSAIQSHLAKEKNADLLDEAYDLVLELQKEYGEEVVVCAAPCGSYGSVALRVLWDLLTFDQAKAEVWKSKTIKLEKYEKDPKLAASALMALSQGYACLGKTKESKELYDLALKKYHDAGSLTGLPAGAVKNLLPCVSHGF